MCSVPFPSWLHQPGGCQEVWGWTLGLEMGPRLGVLVSPSLLNYVQELGLSHVFAQALGAELSLTGPT